MAAELQLTFRLADATPTRYGSQTLANTALRASARLWFLVTVAGQLFFAFTVVSFYALTAARGDFWAWNRHMMHGYVAGDSMGNTAVAIHLLSAVVIILAGAVQFVPQIRNRFPVFHRWVGRIYMLTAFTLSTAGLYMQFVRGSFGDASQRWGSVLNAVVIFLCASMAVRYAIARDFRTHRQWTLRLFLVVSAAWFFRAGLFLSFLLYGGPFGFDPSTFTGPFLTFMSYATFLFPLAVAELYFRAQDRPGVLRRYAMAAGLFVLTIATGTGVVVVAAAMWVPSIQAAYDNRKSIAHILSDTAASRGVDAAVRQYRELKVAGPANYNFDENQLNTLGYQFVRAKQFKDAIRIFALNVESYPTSSNACDSLAEAYMDDGDIARAIANYRKAIELNPGNSNAVATLKKLLTRGVSNDQS